MDGAEEGVILFSLGSLLKSTELPLDKRNAIVRTFGKLKQRVVWKYENDTLPGKPGNVKISKWLPVNDVLGKNRFGRRFSVICLCRTFQLTQISERSSPTVGL